METETKKIVIIGPESTGKTSTCKHLAEKYNTIFIKEHARKYLSNLDKKYNYNDLKNIAKEQIKQEEKAILGKHKIIFYDTNILTIKIWSNFKYKKCDPFITEQANKKKYDLYILCNNDITWQYDILRENKNERKKIFDIYLHELKNKNFKILKKTGMQRFKNAENICNVFLKTNT